MSSPSTTAARLVPRDGLGPAGSRLGAEPGTVAYLGASVTVQRDGYRPRLHGMIERRTGHEHRDMPAGMGGVGVVSVVFLMDMLLFPKSPDLCLVDYSSADLASKSSPEQIEHAVEGIARKLRAAGLPACFLYLPRAEWTERADAVVDAWERVADRYGIPSIDVTPALHELVDAGSERYEDLLFDGLHTTSEGSDVVASLVDSALGELLDGPASDPSPLPAGAGPGRRYASATTVPAQIEHAIDGGSEGRYRLMLPYVELEPGQHIRFEPPGELAGLVVLRGPDAGEIVVSGEGGEQRISVWDEFCWYPRLSTIELERTLPAGEPFTIEFTGEPSERAPLMKMGVPVETPIPPEVRFKLVAYMVFGDDDE